MTNQELNKMLISSFPNLVEAYNEEVSWQEGDDTGAHIVYGDVLTPYFVRCIEGQNVGEVIKILNFIERILSINNKYSNEVVAFSVLENIEFSFKDSNLLNNNYGKLTKKVIEEIRKSNY